MKVGEILDAAKTARKIRTDMALAEALGVSRSAVSSWRHGVQLPDAVRCDMLATMTGLPLAKVLGIVGEARALSHDEKAVWKRLASAAAVALILGGTPLPGSPSPASYDAPRGPCASVSHRPAGIAYYVRRIRRLARFLREALVSSVRKEHALLPLPC